MSSCRPAFDALESSQRHRLTWLGNRPRLVSASSSLLPDLVNDEITGRSPWLRPRQLVVSIHWTSIFLEASSHIEPGLLPLQQPRWASSQELAVTIGSNQPRIFPRAVDYHLGPFAGPKRSGEISRVSSTPFRPSRLHLTKVLPSSASCSIST